MLISEDKINKAVDESIERFMLEEANFFTNALYNWMDKRTGGQWNTKYGLYPDYGNINARSSVSWMQMYKIYGIFTKWLEYHRTQLYRRAQSDSGYGRQNGSNKELDKIKKKFNISNETVEEIADLVSEYNRCVGSKGFFGKAEEYLLKLRNIRDTERIPSDVMERVMYLVRMNDGYTTSSAEEYAKKYINTNNFVEYAMRYFSGFQIKNKNFGAIRKFLTKMEKYINSDKFNVSTLIRNMTYSYFYKNYC